MAGFRGIVGGIFALLASACMVMWIILTPELRALGRGVFLDAQLVMVLATVVVGLVAMVLSWSTFGRGMVAAVGLVLVGQGVLATVMAMGGLVITGRPGPPAPVSVWTIMAAMLGLVAVVMGVWRSPDEVVVGRRQLIGSWVATLLAIAAVGVPAMSVSVAGAAPSPLMTAAGPYVGQAMTGILVILLATAGLRARRASAVGQAVATMALMASAVWLPAVLPWVEVDTRPKDIAVVLAILAVGVWSFTAGSPEWDDDLLEREDDGAGRPLDLRPAIDAGAQHPRTVTAVLDPIGDATELAGPGAPDRDPTIVVADRDQTEVVATTHAGHDQTQRIPEQDVRH